MFMIAIKDLNVKFGKTVIYDNVSIEIPNTGINFLMGKNGAGKTTLIKCLLDFMGYLGEITINNRKYENNKREVFTVFDDSPLYKNLTGLQNIMLITGMKKNLVYEYAEKFLSKKLLTRSGKNSPTSTSGEMNCQKKLLTNYCINGTIIQAIKGVWQVYE